MYDFNLVIYLIFFATLWSLPFCEGATHWVVTEDGRIQQQADSIFNLKSPYDLVTFIHQQSAYDRLKILREEYLEEKRKVIEARERERAEIQLTFYKEDPDCVDAGKHITEFKLYLDMTNPFTTNDINIPDHVSLCQPLPSHFEPPYCRNELPTVIYSYDHLEGVNGKHQLNASVEPTLLASLSSYFKTAEDLGGHVSVAMEQNSSSWVLLNLAAYYWRIKGNGLEAIECLRQALYFSPREHKDQALVSLAAVLYHANYSHESLVLLHAAMDTGNELSLYHFLLGNIYASLKMYEMADLSYRFMLVMSPDTESLCERVKAVRCELKLTDLLQQQHLNFNESMDSLKTPELDLTTKLSSEELEKKQLLPLEVFKMQLKQMFALIQDSSRYQDTCKSRASPLEKNLPTQSDPGGPKDKQTNEALSGETVTSASSREDSKYQAAENKSATIQIKTLEKSTPMTQSIEPTPYLKVDYQQTSGDSKDQENGKSGIERLDKTSETLSEAANAPSDNSNISSEEETMRNLQEARLALNRLNSIIKTVSCSRQSASSTMDVADEMSSQSGSSVDSGDASKTTSTPIKATSTKSAQMKAGDSQRVGRRGEIGVMMPSRDSDRRKDNAEIIFLEETKFSKQKGESLLISKNGPGLKWNEMASKNTREDSNVELLFEKAKGSRHIGPKHTPPLQSQDMLVLAQNCHSVGAKRRKGEASAMECLTQDTDLQTQSSTTPFTIPQTNAETDFSKSTTNSEQTGSDDSAKVSSNDMASDQSSLKEKVRENGEENKVDRNETIDGKSEKDSDLNVVGNSEMKGSKQSEIAAPVGESEGAENSDSTVVDKSELKISSDQDSGVEKTSEEEDQNLEESGKDNGEGEGKISSPDRNANEKFNVNGDKDSKQNKHATVEADESLEKGEKSTSSKSQMEEERTDYKSRKTVHNDKASQTIKERVREAEFLHKVGAGSNVFETNFMNVRTSGALHELSDEECKHIEGVHALIMRNKHFSAWLSLDTKNIDVRTHMDFVSDVHNFAKEPRCTAKIRNNFHTFASLQGLANAGKLEQVAEAGLTQIGQLCLSGTDYSSRATLLTVGRTLQDSIDEMGTRIFNALQKNSTSWVLLNIASLYWRVQGDTAEAIKCLRQALSFSPPNARDVAHVGLASILLREGHLDDTVIVIKKALEVSPSLALGHFILGNVFGAQSNIPEAIQHYLLALQLEPGFTPAVERLKIIQCVLWKQQKALEKEASDLRKLLTPN